MVPSDITAFSVVFDESVPSIKLNVNELLLWRLIDIDWIEKRVNKIKYSAIAAKHWMLCFYGTHKWSDMKEKEKKHQKVNALKWDVVDDIGLVCDAKCTLQCLHIGVYVIRFKIMFSGIGLSLSATCRIVTAAFNPYLAKCTYGWMYEAWWMLIKALLNRFNQLELVEWDNGQFVRTLDHSQAIEGLIALLLLCNSLWNTFNRSNPIVFIYLLLASHHHRRQHNDSSAHLL